MKKITELRQLIDWLPTRTSRITLLVTISAAFGSGVLSTFLVRVLGLKSEAEIALLESTIVLGTLLIGALIVILDLLIHISRKATENRNRERRPSRLPFRME